MGKNKHTLTSKNCFSNTTTSIETNISVKKTYEGKSKVTKGQVGTPITFFLAFNMRF